MFMKVIKMKEKHRTKRNLVGALEMSQQLSVHPAFAEDPGGVPVVLVRCSNLQGGYCNVCTTGNLMLRTNSSICRVKDGSLNTK